MNEGRLSEVPSGVSAEDVEDVVRDVFEISR